MAQRVRDEFSRYKLLPKDNGSVYAKTLWLCHVLSWSYKELSSNLRMKFRSLLKALLQTVEIKSVVTRPGGDKLTPCHILFFKSQRASQRLEGNVRWAGDSHPLAEFLWALYHPPESSSGHLQPSVFWTLSMPQVVKVLGWQGQPEPALASENCCESFQEACKLAFLNQMVPDSVLYACEPGIWGTEAGGSGILGQPGLNNKALILKMGGGKKLYKYAMK